MLPPVQNPTRRQNVKGKSYRINRKVHDCVLSRQRRAELARCLLQERRRVRTDRPEAESDSGKATTQVSQGTGQENEKRVAGRIGSSPFLIMFVPEARTNFVRATVREIPFSSSVRRRHHRSRHRRRRRRHRSRLGHRRRHDLRVDELH
jgi:hypothetical protein